MTMRIPFEAEIDDFNEMAGFLYLEDDYLVFEYDILKLGILKANHVVVKAERGLINDLRIKHGLFKDRLFVASHSPKLLNEVPGKHASEIQLNIKRRYRRDLDVFVDAVLEWVDEEPA